MSLVVHSDLQIDEIEKLVRLNFEDVENKEVDLRFEDWVDPFPGELKKVLRVKTVKNIRELRVKWILKDWSKLWEYNHGSIISHIIGHEGPHSLLSTLIKQGLALGLSSSRSSMFNYTNPQNTGNYEEFTITIWCTEKGLDQYWVILSHVFSAIKLLLDVPFEEFDRINNELGIMNDLGFTYLPVSNALESCNKYSAWLTNF